MTSNILLPYSGGDIRVIDANQYDVPVFNKGWKCKQLLLLGRGLREYVYFRLDNPFGEIRYYIEEKDSSSNQLKFIDDEELALELADYIDAYHARIKPEGSTVG